MSDIVIRRSRPEDADGIAKNIKTINTPEEILGQIALFHERIAAGTAEHLVADDGGEIVGNLFLSRSRYFPPDQPHRGELGDVVVASSHQGTGLLRRLVDAAAERAREMGMTQLEIASHSENARALRAWERAGFTQWGRLPNADRRGSAMVFFFKELDS